MCRLSAELIARGPSEQKVRFPVSLSSVSADGLGLTLLGSRGMQVSGDELVHVLMDVDGGLELPGQIVRFQSTSDAAGLFAVGVRLRPEIATARHRRAYLDWVERHLDAGCVPTLRVS